MTNTSTATQSSAHREQRDLGLAQLHSVTNAITQNIERVLDGKREAISWALMVLLADGHLLIEDVPGVGKTLLSKALARSIDGSVRRIQFTPDLLPSDVTGVSIFNQETRDFEFRPGGVFANIVLGDEINRASPKTQSALLEAMEERQVSVDGKTYRLASPFMVMATQNPIEMEGTYALPEAQRDRFMARIAMGYPTAAAEAAMLGHHIGTDPLTSLRPVTDAATVQALIEVVGHTYVAPPVRDYAVALAQATRNHSDLSLGASPRATLHLVRAGQATAAMAGRDYVVPDDLRNLTSSLWSHRVIVARGNLGARRSAQEILAEAVSSVPVPDGRRSSAEGAR